jgi:hypothetical protein
MWCTILGNEIINGDADFIFDDMLIDLNVGQVISRTNLFRQLMYLDINNEINKTEHVLKELYIINPRLNKIFKIDTTTNFN